MSILAFLFFNIVLLAAATVDMCSFRIPNRLCLLLACGGIVLHWPHGWGGALERLATVGALGVGGLGLYSLRLLGGGDYKLLLACAVWLPISQGPGFAATLALIGGGQALATLAYGRLAPVAGWPRLDVRHIPYAVSIAASGFAWSLPQALGGGAG
jgi:prepilin peptidase CpaA